MNAALARAGRNGAYVLFALILASACTVGAPSTAPTDLRSAAADTPLPSPTTSTSPSAAPSAQPSAVPSPSARTAVKVYFAFAPRGGDDSPGGLVAVAREADQTPALATAAVRALLAGPTAEERSGAYAGKTGRFDRITSEVPAGTVLLGLHIENGRATVNLSSDFGSPKLVESDPESWAYRLAQVVYTLTQFPTVERVRFQLDGKSIQAIEGHEGTAIDVATRAAYTDQLHGVFIDEPAWEGTVSRTFTVRGIVQLLGDRFQAALIDGTTGKVLAQRTVRSPCGMGGCWQPPGGGSFEFRLAIPAGASRADLRLRINEAPEEPGSAAFEYPLR